MPSTVTIQARFLAVVLLSPPRHEGLLPAGQSQLSSVAYGRTINVRRLQPEGPPRLVHQTRQVMDRRIALKRTLASRHRRSCAPRQNELANGTEGAQQRRRAIYQFGVGTTFSGGFGESSTEPELCRSPQV